MRYKILCVRDRALDTYGQPFFSASVGAAIRSFSDEINRADPNNQLNKHPGDFDLFSLGEFDDASGEFDATRPQQIAVGKDLLLKA